MLATDEGLPHRNSTALTSGSTSHQWVIKLQMSEDEGVRYGADADMFYISGERSKKYGSDDR